MPLMPRHFRSEHGFTLIEILVAMVTGLIVVGAAFTILEVSMRQSGRIADKVNANQRGRVALEKIMLELHSSCVANGANPIMATSTATRLIFQSHSGSSEPFFTTGLKHEIYLEGTTLFDRTFQSTSGIESRWLWSATPLATVPLLTKAYAPASGSMFEYFKYTKLTPKELEEGNHVALNQILVVPLGAEDAKAAAKVNVNFSAAPDTNNTATPLTVAFSAGAVLRLTPATDVGSNEPCE